MSDSTPLEDFLTVPQAANSLGVSEGAIRNAITDGRLASTRIDGIRKVARTELDAYRQRTRPAGYKPSGRPRKNPPTVDVLVVPHPDKDHVSVLPEQDHWEEQQLLLHLRVLAREDRRHVLELVKSLAVAYAAYKESETEKMEKYERG